MGTKLRIGGLELGQGLILAPMAGITDLGFRRIAKSFDVDLVTSEMVSAEGLVRKNESTKNLLRSHPEEKPLAVQIFGGDPTIMAEAARIVEAEGADIIDVNMGCPVAKVVRQGAGAAIIKDLERVKRTVDAVRQAVSIPLTVKARSGWNTSRINIVEVAKAAEEAGADAVTTHPRTAKQALAGTADWSLIARVRQAVSIPVIGNGDVTRPEQVEEMKHYTGCDGVMIGRAAIGNPWIFKQAKQLDQGVTPVTPSPHERLQVLRRHLALYEECPEKGGSHSGFRRRIMWYTKTLPNSKRLRAALNNFRDRESMIEICEDFFSTLEMMRVRITDCGPHDSTGGSCES
jgi:nifR3 family TIM-barrel protein